MKKRLLKALVVYGATSYYCLQHPELIHDKKKLKRLYIPPLEEGLTHHIIAHRGGGMENPENTLQAF